jgi:hypothetical protein
MSMLLLERSCFCLAAQVTPTGAILHQERLLRKVVWCSAKTGSITLRSGRNDVGDAPDRESLRSVKQHGTRE